MQAMLTYGNVGDAEVWQDCIRALTPDLANSRCDGLNLDVMPFDHEHARSAGKLRAGARYKDLALAQLTEGQSQQTGNGPTSTSAASSRS